MTSTGTNIARRLWDQREELRAKYEDVHGTDRALWPVQHPGVVLDALPSIAHGACLGCQWFDVVGHSMHYSDWFERASVWPHRQQISRRTLLRSARDFWLRGALPFVGAVAITWVFVQSAIDTYAPDYGKTHFSPDGGVFVIGMGLLVLGIPVAALSRGFGHLSHSAPQAC
jgi:hypothetical protein